jgi:hypothetical protein
LLNTNSAFGPIIDEGITEFLAWKAIKHLHGDSVYNTIVTEKMEMIKGFEALPMAQIHQVQDFGNREFYAYYYSPLVFASIEQIIGERAMVQWMHTMLTTPVTLTDYNFLKETLSATIKDPALLSQIMSQFFENNKVVFHVQ